MGKKLGQILVIISFCLSISFVLILNSVLNTHSVLEFLIGTFFLGFAYNEIFNKELMVISSSLRRRNNFVDFKDVN